MSNVNLTDQPTTGRADRLEDDDDVNAAETYARGTLELRAAAHSCAAYLLATGTDANLAEMFLASIITRAVHDAMAEALRDMRPMETGANALKGPTPPGAGPDLEPLYRT